MIQKCHGIPELLYALGEHPLEKGRADCPKVVWYTYHNFLFRNVQLSYSEVGTRVCATVVAGKISDLPFGQFL